VRRHDEAGGEQFGEQHELGAARDGDGGAVERGAARCGEAGGPPASELPERVVIRLPSRDSASDRKRMVGAIGAIGGIHVMALAGMRFVRLGHGSNAALPCGV
jgi:hypothetical protein